MKSAQRRLLGSKKSAPKPQYRGRGCAIIQAKSGHIGSF
jgi:hypothetical protein